MTNRQLAARETRDKLLAAGKELICEKGLDQTSVEEITEAAGVSKGTFYTYFKRKEDIVSELSTGIFGEILEKAKRSHGDFYEKLTFYMVHFSGYIEQSSVRMAQEWVKNVVCFHDSAKLSYDLASMKDFLELAVKNRALKDCTPVDPLSRMLVDLLYGQMLCWCMSNGSYSLRERTGEFCADHLKPLLGSYVTDKNHQDMIWQ